MYNFFVILFFIACLHLLAQTGFTCKYHNLDGSALMVPGSHQDSHQRQDSSNNNVYSELINGRQSDHHQSRRHHHHHNRRQLKDSTASMNYDDGNNPSGKMSARELESLRVEYNKFKILSELGKTRDPDVKMIDEDLRYRFASSLAKSRNIRSAQSGNSSSYSYSSSSSSLSNVDDGDDVDQHQGRKEDINGNQMNSNSGERTTTTTSSSSGSIGSSSSGGGGGGSSSSSRRRSLTCSQVKNDKDTCCLENFYVNFTQIGWDKWILYPSGYSANYCRGQCDLSHARYYHSTLLSKFSHIIGLCCSPRQMAPLHLLYIDEDNKVHQKSMPNMVVESCDCA